MNRGFSIHLEQQNHHDDDMNHPWWPSMPLSFDGTTLSPHRTTCLCTVTSPAKQPPLECHRWPDKRIVGTKSCCNLKSILVIYRTPSSPQHRMSGKVTVIVVMYRLWFDVDVDWVQTDTCRGSCWIVKLFCNNSISNEELTSTKYVLLTDNITRRLVDWWCYKNLSLQQSTLFRYICEYWYINQEEERSCGYKWEGASHHTLWSCYMLQYT